MGELRLFHNRLTHSLKVAQIGRRLAERMVRSRPEEALLAAGGIDPDVVEAACLAHDLGHPPFGHVAEEELQHILAAHKTDSFEGNAQSFRTVTKLAVRSLDGRDSDRGLDLSRATLRGILKYPWTYKDPHNKTKSSRKWGAYFSERRDLSNALDRAPGKPSAEARLMDVADDITYAIHDFEDFFRAGMIPLEEIRNSSNESDEGSGEEDDADRSFVKYLVKHVGLEKSRAKKVIEGLVNRVVLPLRPFGGTIEDRAALHHTASWLFDHFLNSVSLTDNGVVTVEPEVGDEIVVLKQLTWFYVINRPGLATIQYGHRKIVRTLFECLKDWADTAWDDKKEASRLPIHLHSLLMRDRDDEEAWEAAQRNEERLRVRSVADYIASLTEAQAFDLHERLTGISPRSAVETWVHH